MSENINLRPISELTEVEAVSTGDKILLNSNGEAKLIDASKVGGSGGGGGGVIYLSIPGLDKDPIYATCYADEALTQPLDYATGRQLIMSGANGYFTASNDGVTDNVVFSFLAAVDVPSNNIMQAFVANFTNEEEGAFKAAILLFSDTVM